MSTIGTRLREARQRRFLTQAELSKETGVQIVTISRIENDRGASHPHITTVRKLANALDVEPFWLMFGEASDDAKKATARGNLAVA